MVISELWKNARYKEQIWRQKYRLKWLREGDKNTRYFHIVTKARYPRNEIEGLIDDNQWIYEPKQVKNMVLIKLF